MTLRYVASKIIEGNDEDFYDELYDEAYTDMMECVHNEPSEAILSEVGGETAWGQFKLDLQAHFWRS